MKTLLYVSCLSVPAPGSFQADLRARRRPEVFCLGFYEKVQQRGTLVVAAKSISARCNPQRRRKHGRNRPSIRQRNPAELSNLVLNLLLAPLLRNHARWSEFGKCRVVAQQKGPCQDAVGDADNCSRMLESFATLVMCTLSSTHPRRDSCKQSGGICSRNSDLLARRLGAGRTRDENAAIRHRIPSRLGTRLPFGRRRRSRIQ